MTAGPRSQAAVAWCRSVVGPCTVRDLGGRRPGAVLAIEAPGFAGVLKLADGPAAGAAERHAAECWAPALAGEAPRLVASSPELGAVLLTALGGRPAVSADAAMCWHAGAALARLQGVVPVRRCPVGTPVDLVAGDLRRWLDEGRDLLSPTETAVGAAALDRVSVVGGEGFVPCHGDFRPRNWLVDDDGRWIGMVDFEHARYDLAEVDLAVLWDGDLAGASAQRAALVRGYGGLDRSGVERLTVLRVVAALARTVGGARAAAADDEARGRAALAGLHMRLGAAR